MAAPPRALFFWKFLPVFHPSVAKWLLTGGHLIIGVSVYYSPYLMIFLVEIQNLILKDFWKELCPMSCVALKRMCWHTAFCEAWEKLRCTCGSSSESDVVHNKNNQGHAKDSRDNQSYCRFSLTPAPGLLGGEKSLGLRYSLIIRLW